MIYLTERVEYSGEGGFDQVWHVLPPPVGQKYRVLRDRWYEPVERCQRTDMPVRHIYEIEVER